MKFLNSKAAMIGVGVLAGGVVLYFVGKKLFSVAGDAAAAVGNAVNPVSHDNLANRAVGAVGSALSGDDEWTLGGWLFDVTHGGAYDPNAPTTRTPTLAPAPTRKELVTDNFYERGALQ